MTDALVPESPAEVQAAVGYERPETLAWDSRLRRTVTVYIPLALFVLVLQNVAIKGPIKAFTMSRSSFLNRRLATVDLVIFIAWNRAMQRYDFRQTKCGW